MLAERHFWALCEHTHCSSSNGWVVLGPWSAGAWLSTGRVWTHPGVNALHFVTEFDPLISSNLRITASKENHQDQLELVPTSGRGDTFPAEGGGNEP